MIPSTLRDRSNKRCACGAKIHPLQTVCGWCVLVAIVRSNTPDFQA